MNIRFASILLQFKLTLMFVLFGLLVGFSSYLVSTVSNTKMLVDQFLNRDENSIKTISDNSNNDWILDLGLTVATDSKTREMLRTLIPAEFKESIAIEFYYKNSDNFKWYLLRDTSKQGVPVHEINSSLMVQLEDVLEVGVIEADHSFIKFYEPLSLYLDVTETGDIHEYVVHIKINRENLFQYIIKNRESWSIYTIITLTISFLLGFIFARSISKPLWKLSDKAIALSKGDLDVRFKTKRLDDIGELSRSFNEMAINIGNRIHTIETMNHIDKAVNSSLSRKELLSRVSGYIADQFKTGTVYILEKNASSYNILASSPKSFLLPDTYIFDAADKIITKKTNITLPLIHSERIAGYLVVFKKDLGKKDGESLELLADQVSVALLNMKEVEDREIMYNAMLLSLTRSVDTKSRWTAGHSERVTENAVILAGELGLNHDECEMIRIASLLHDLGKLGISESILDKPGKLTHEEYLIIQNHPVMGEQIIKDIPDFSYVRNVVRSHHERWDGTGYPDGLEGDSIPIAARIVSIADVWDAITADRPYRIGFKKEKALDIMKSEKSKMFDPDVLDVFLRKVLKSSI